MFDRRKLLTRSAAASLALAARSALSSTAFAQEEAVPSPQASPPESPALANAPLIDFLAHTPVSLASLPQPILGYFANPALQATTLGVPVPSDLQSDSPEVSQWVRAMMPLFLPSVAASGLKPEYREVAGWDIAQISSSFELGEPPEAAILLRGSFNLDEIRQAQEDAGYRTINIDGQEVRSLNEEGRIDLDSPVGSLVLAAFNNFATLSDGTLVYTRTLDSLRQVIATETEVERALAVDPAIGPMVSAIDQPLASAALVTAVALAQRPPLTLDPETGPEDIAAAATEFAEQLSEPALPPPIYALFGITAGGPIDLGDDSGLAVDEQPVSAARISAHFGTAEAAAEAAPIIRERLETGSFQSTGEPYTDRFASWQVDVVERQPLVVISIESKDRPIDLRGMLYQRDVGFLAW